MDKYAYPLDILNEGYENINLLYANIELSCHKSIKEEIDLAERTTGLIFF